MEGVTWGMSFIPSCCRSFGWRGGARVAMGTAQHSVAAWARTSLLPQSSSPSTPECQGCPLALHAQQALCPAGTKGNSE